MNTWFSERIGQLGNFVLPSEEKSFPCSLEVFKVILILRKLLGDTVNGLFYKTDDEYDSGDLCMSETTILVHTKANYGKSEEYKVVGHFVHDSASNIDWPDKREYVYYVGDDTGPRTVSSNGALTAVNIETPFGSTSVLPLNSLLALFYSAAAAGGYELIVEKIDKRGSYRLRVRKLFSEARFTHLATIHANESDFYACTRYQDNLAIELI